LDLTNSAVARRAAVLLFSLFAAAPCNASDLLVASQGSDQLLRFDGQTGAFQSVFATIHYPFGLAADGAGHVYVSTLDGAIARYDETGTLLDFVVVPGAPILGWIAIGPDDRVYATSFFESRVVRADFSISPPQYLGDWIPPGGGGLSGPTGLVFGGPDGDLYVSSRINGLILHYDAFTGGSLGTFANPGNQPQGLSFGPDGNHYVARASTDDVQRFDPNTQSDLGVFAQALGDGSDGMTPIFGPDGDLYLSVPAVADQIERFDGKTGASQGLFVPVGSVTLPTQMVFIPEPSARAAGWAVLAALASLVTRARNR